jgi:hypothetical protein
MNELFNVMVDSEVMDVREGAKAGDFHSMVLLGTYIQRGWHTRQNMDWALRIYDHVISQIGAIVADIGHHEQHHFANKLRIALNQKGYVHASRGEYDQAEEAYLAFVREETKQPLEEWDHENLIAIMEWLWARQEDKNAEVEQ